MCSSAFNTRSDHFSCLTFQARFSLSGPPKPQSGASMLGGAHEFEFPEFETEGRIYRGLKN